MNRTLKEVMNDIDTQESIDRLVVDFNMYLLDIGYWAFSERLAEDKLNEFELVLSTMNTDNLKHLDENGIFSLSSTEGYKIN